MEANEQPPPPPESMEPVQETTAQVGEQPQDPLQLANQVTQEAQDLEPTAEGQMGAEAISEADARSIFVSNVDFQTHPQELQAHFISCGAIERITILVNKKTQHPKGSAYVQFTERDSARNALQLNGSQFKGRPLKVVQKMSTVPASVLRAMYRPRPFGGYRPRRPMAPYYRRPFRGRGAFFG